ncbi:flavin reductase family protein [Aeromicrobium panaciterrae]
MNAIPSVQDSAVNPDDFRHAIGHFPTGVAVITTTVNGEAHGATVSALSSLSLEPPMLIVCLKDTSRTLTAVKQSGRFLVNLLAEDQADIAAHFATRDGAKLAPTEPGKLPGIPGVLGAIACEVDSMVRGGSHIILMATVTAVEMASAGRPLTYYRGRFGGFLPALTLVKPSD